MIFSAKLNKRWLSVIAMALPLFTAQDHTWPLGGEASQAAGPVQVGTAQAESNSVPATGEAIGAAAGVPTKPEPTQP